MAAWEYLHVSICGDGKSEFGTLKCLSEAKDMRVTTSDGRFRHTKMPTDAMGFVQQLGSEGWEMVTANDGGPKMSVLAWFKRQR